MPFSPRPLAPPLRSGPRHHATSQSLAATAPRPTARRSRRPPGAGFPRAALRELGRLREAHSRPSVEGTGRPLDLLDVYDGWYDHIVLWDAPTAGSSVRIASHRGRRCSPNVHAWPLHRLPVDRLSRAHVPRMAWNSGAASASCRKPGQPQRRLVVAVRSLSARTSRVRYLFGAVSISAALPPARTRSSRTRRITAIRCLRIIAPALAYRPRRRRWPASTRRQPRCSRQPFETLAVPMLYKQYTELCEPGGARFLAFGVDPDFATASTD